MATVTPPKSNVAIGTVEIDGARYEVKQNDELLRFFASLVGRVGGVSGTSTEELSLSQFEDAGIEESKAMLFSLTDEMRAAPVPVVHSATADDPSGEVSALREELAAIRSRLDALEQGVQL